ncbi:MAG: hypothetical protein VXZ67_06765 [Pseudomonadota bacterium]|nr:hypothetical protein [Pseudomonadota bacterium]
MAEALPALGIVIDLPLGILMWAAILRFLLSMFVKEDSRLGLMRVLNAVVMPPTRAAVMVAPRWVIERTGPLYLSFLLFIARYYILPLVVGYDVTGFGAMPLEGLLLSVRAEVGL